ncbi:MAG: hypothetical protein KAZ88_00935 [Acidimicrobiia bacterium]|nr:hypothetical protein [Acidimicrobiia bacterium]
MFYVGLAAGVALVCVAVIVLKSRASRSVLAAATFEQFVPPWRDYVRDAQRRPAELDALKAGESTSIRQEIERVERAVLSGTEAVTELATIGQKLQRVLVELDPPLVERELSRAMQETATPSDQTSGRIAALQRKQAQVASIGQAIEKTRGQIALLDAQLEEATVSTVALVHTGQLHLETPQIEEQLTSAVVDVQSMQAALKEASETY